ncbi:TSUP family transporter, partial [Streptococcus hyovaginalis]
MNLPMIKEESEQQIQIKRQKIFFCIILIILVSIGLTTAFLGRREGNYQLFTLMLIVVGDSCIETVAGGGGLITVPGLMLKGIPFQTRIATNKFSSGIADLSSDFYLKRNKKTSFPFLFFFIFLTVFGV